MNVKIIAAAIATLTLTAQAEKYDYEVEYVKSTRESVVKTDLVPTTGMVFKIDARFIGDYLQRFDGRFDGKRHTTEFFGQHDTPSDDEFKSRYAIELGGHEKQRYCAWAHLGACDAGRTFTDAIISNRVSFAFDGRTCTFGWFTVRFNQQHGDEAWKTPVAFFGIAVRDGSTRCYANYEMELYGASFYRGGKCVADFIPVVKGGVAGIYDKVGKKFFASVTSTPLVAGPKKTKKVEKTGGGGGKGKTDFEIPIFEEDFSNMKVFSERWTSFGHFQNLIEPRDGAVRINTSESYNGISWRGELPDDCAIEADLVCFPEWCGEKDPCNGGYHWANIRLDDCTFGVRGDGNGVCLYRPEDSPGTKGCYPRLSDFRPQQPMRVRVERRRVGERMMSYAYYVNGTKHSDFVMNAPKKEIGFDGVARWPKAGVANFQCPFECRRFAVYQLKSEGSPNLIGNSGFEYDNDGVPMNYCNRGKCRMETVSVADYRDKYLGSFAVDRGEKHSGKQSLRLGLGAYQQHVQFFPWGTPTAKGRAAVFSFWAKGSETNLTLEAQLAGKRHPVQLTTDWRRYEFTTTNMPAADLFSPVWFRVPDAKTHMHDAAIWLDDLQLEFAEAPAGGFDPAKRYATEYRPRSGDAERFALGKPGPHPKPDRLAPLTPAENALCGYALPTNGLVLGRYDFYMNEPTADFRVWDGQGGFEQVSLDLAKLPCGTNAVTVKALGRDWPASVVKREFKKGATQINQWSRSLVHDGKPLFFSALCLIGRENFPKDDGVSTQVDILADAGFKHVLVNCFCCTRDIEACRKITRYAAQRGMKSVIWPGEGNLQEEGEIKDWNGKLTDHSRRWMYDELDSDDVVAVIAMDEPEFRNAEACKDFMKRQKAQFPYKPVLLNCSSHGIAGRFAGLPTDVLMIDYYLTNEGITLEMVVSKVDSMRSIAPGRPCWYWMESENSIHWRIPSRKEQIAQCWGATAAGASGISWFVNMPTSYSCYDGIRDFNREVLDNESFLCSDELCGGAIASETSNYIRCLTRKVGDEWRIYTVNVNPHPNAKVAFRLPPEIPQDAKLEVMYENRTVQAKGGLFGDAFDGYSRHIYRVKK